MADVGFKVVGVEIRDDVLAKLRSGKAHFYEPGLDDLIQRLVRKKSIKFVKHIPNGLRASVYIVTVGTPLGPNGRVRLDMVESVGREVAKHLKPHDLVILRSTLKIGTTRKIIMPLLKKSGNLFDLAFCPERTLEGQALSELRQLPQIVGGATFHSAIRASQIFQFLTPTVVRVSDLETAEMIKLIDNTSRDVSFAFANETARICDRVGVSAMEVIRAGKLGYPRTNLPMPGLVGGPCLEKDPYILSEGLKEMGLTPDITLTSRKLNERQPDEVVAYLQKLLRTFKGFKKNPTIALLGIAFKGRPATDDLRGTMAKPVFKALKKYFPTATFRGFDPVVPAAEIKKFGLAPFSSLEKVFQKTDLALITNNHPVFAAMPLERYADKMSRPALVYDFWNSLSVSSLHMPTGTGYMALGSHGKAILPTR
jgi:nucleotide sugar dehydrogenase